ncbi:LysR family transcriptional regulator [Trinickia fusca]|uniref:LysR family transcriptional regulator n=1 Tax=Trinickia fusca TaxID=2419777 RepID=A0A494XJ78_9BURK|nr:LysR family transcriptional regulator [Trinickia fusca]RKP50730.1 LysR family transcriptional regulator [Trinickia fusca]
MDPAHLPALVAFASVARHESFTRAAAESGVSASALSQTIRGLETRLHVRLFNRTTRRVALTEAGARFLDEIRPALAQLELAFDTLDEARDEPAGTLRINLPRPACELLVMPYLAEFTRTYPRIALELTLDDGLADLVGDRFDAGIRIGELVARDMVAIPLSGALRIAVAGSPAYFARYPKPLVPDDLVRHDCLRYRFSTGGGIYRWEFSRPGESGSVFDVETRGTLVTNDLRTMVLAAEEGVGLLHAFEDNVRQQLADGRLVRVLDDWCPMFEGFFLYTASRKQMPPKLRVFIDFLRGKQEVSRGVR